MMLLHCGLVDCSVILFFASTALVKNAITTAVSNNLIFYIVPQPIKGLVRIGSSWQEISAGSCAARCTMKFPNCRSFMYNPSTGLCTPGSWINEQHPAPTAIEGNLYHSFSCNQSAGFRFIQSHSQSACVGKFGPSMTYLHAKEACRQRGGFLASVKTWDKMMMLKDAFGVSEDVWVGCDEMAQEDRFVWEEDGEVLPMGSPLFASYQPDDRETDEDCVCLQREGQQLGDWDCSMWFTYFCEISVP